MKVVVFGKKWERKRASSVAFPACNDGKAPNTRGELVNVSV